MSELDKSSASVRTRGTTVETAHIKAHLLLANKSSKESKGLLLPFPFSSPPVAVEAWVEISPKYFPK